MDAINATELGKTIWSFKHNYSIVRNKLLHERQKYLEKNHNFQREKSNNQTQFPRESFRSTSHFKISEIPLKVGPTKFWYYQNINCKNSAFAILATI